MTQSKQPRQPWEWVVLFVAIAAAIVIAVSCNPISKIARKNEKAYQTVINDSTLHRKAWYLYNKNVPPCTNDTIIGETQVLILSDTQYVGNTDTLKIADTIRITTTKTNTVTKYVVDNRAIHELQDSFHAAQVREAQLRGIILQLKSDKAEQEKRVVLAEKKQRQAWWVVYILIGLFILTHAWRSIPSIRKAIGV